MAAGSEFRLKQAAVRRVSAPPLHSEEPLNSPEAAIRVMAKELKDYDREVVCLVNLQTDLKPINFSIASMGALDSSVLHPRELMKAMFLSNASRTMLIHNHPSGSLRPSKEDIEITDRMAQLCQLAGIPLLDHIIIGAGNDREYFSFHEKGILKAETPRYAQTMEELQMPLPMVAEARPSVLEKLDTKREAKAGDKSAPQHRKTNKEEAR